MALKRIISVLSAAFAILHGAGGALAYPLNGHPLTAINRLEGYFYSLRTQSGKENFVPGALLALSEIRLTLEGSTLDLPPPDPAFTRQLIAQLGADAPAYNFAVLDFSDPARPLYAAHHEGKTFIPGSVGKIVVALAFFQKLADLYPDDIEKRVAILRDTMVTADDIIESDTHEVPFWHYDEGRIEFRPLRVGDTGNLYMWLDWMLSASSNAAGSAVIKELVLLSHFGKRYPAPPAEAEAYLKRASKSELAGLMQSAVSASLRKNGLNPAALYHASPFTRSGKQRIPARGSGATARELVRYFLRMEQGRLIDKFSSLELKRLLYVTQQRVRYAASPALNFSAVYYKSGSMYSCRPEGGFACGKYRGNVQNLLNSAALIEHPYSDPRLHYIVALNSNVLRKDSAEKHKDFAAMIQRILSERHPRNAE